MFLTAFTCQEQGIFANTDSNDCKTFVSCDSSLVSSIQNCRDNTYFWPEQKGCFSNYDCATSSMLDNINPCEGSIYYGYENVPDSSDCSSYLVCDSTTMYLGNVEALVPQVYSRKCYGETAYRPDYGCVDDYQCSDYQCTAEGLFEDPNANDCSTFVTCSKFITSHNPSVPFYAFLNTCPSDTKFNPMLNKCDGFYNCDQVDPHGGVDPCAEFNYANPFIPNPYDSDISSYIECHYDEQFSSIIKRQCPAMSSFKPLLGKCYNNYDPNETCSKDPCSSGPGRYADFKSGGCDNFVECRDESETLDLYKPIYQKLYCPPGTRFSPETVECSQEYVCPTIPEDYCYPQIATTTTSTTTTTTVA